MTEELVTIVRYRVVIEEMVMPRKEFEAKNAEAKLEHDNGSFEYEFANYLPKEFEDWGWGDNSWLVGPESVDQCDREGYKVFNGDITSCSDDYVRTIGEWQCTPPFTINEENYFDQFKKPNP